LKKIICLCTGVIEELILRHKDAPYIQGRSSSFMRVKVQFRYRNTNSYISVIGFETYECNCYWARSPKEGNQSLHVCSVHSVGLSQKLIRNDGKHLWVISRMTSKKQQAQYPHGLQVSIGYYECNSKGTPRYPRIL
jgi:hypothetical protein